MTSSISKFFIQMGMSMENMATMKKKKGSAMPAEATPIEDMVGCPRGSRTGTMPVHC